MRFLGALAVGFEGTMARLLCVFGVVAGVSRVLPDDIATANGEIADMGTSEGRSRHC